MAARTGPSRTSAKRPVLYQLCRAGEIFEVGDGPVALNNASLVIGRGDPRRTDAGDGRVFVDDPWMSGKHAQLVPLERPAGRAPTDSSWRMTGPGRFVIEDMGSTNGVLVNGVPSTKAPLLHGDLVETGRTFWIYVEESSADPLLAEPFELGGVSTWTPSFARHLADLLPRVTTPDHVLLVGSEGTGKGFLARTIHVVSGRPGRFVHLDCRERKAKRLLVDLFGDETHSGRLRDAENGTFFLENVDALPLDVQDRLADQLKRARAGSRGTQSARVVASMNVGVDDALADATLRPAIVDVIGTVQVRMPSLGQRLPDLGLLLDDFLARARGAPAISRDACRAVLRYPFRAHVRAMARTIEAAATLAGVSDAKVAGGHSGSIEIVHLPVDVVGPDVLRQLVPGNNNNSSMGASVPDNTSEAPAVTGSDSAASPSTRAPSEMGELDDVFSDDATDPLQMRRSGTRSNNPKLSPGAAAANAAAAAGGAAAGAGGAGGAAKNVGARPNTRPVTPAHGVAAMMRSDVGDPQVDVDTISAALRTAHGNVSAAARALGRPRAVLLRWIRELGIDPSTLR